MKFKTRLFIRRILCRLNNNVWASLFIEYFQSQKKDFDLAYDLCGYDGFFLSRVSKKINIKEYAIVDIHKPDKIHIEKHILCDLCSDAILSLSHHVDIVILNNAFNLLPDVFYIEKYLKKSQPEYIFVTTPMTSIMKEFNRKYQETSSYMNDHKRDVRDFFSKLGYTIALEIPCIRFHYLIDPMIVLFFSIIPPFKWVMRLNLKGRSYYTAYIFKRSYIR